ncbi:hypothetical protein MiSe_90800 [Microseira wollei NIES-4236]|uniref:Uncharacterized protein n=2 Tax=Microseira wollei TaxID=467598 RepID=A0AAV3XNZ6_9CYAN|nr:hypothetical protein MiSe_90800 [Microseira wollei NIES-4236]
MPYATIFERLNRQEDIIDILETRFREVPNELVDAINQVEDADLLKTLHRRAVTIESLFDFQQSILPWQMEDNE